MPRRYQYPPTNIRTLSPAAHSSVTAVLQATTWTRTARQSVKHSASNASHNTSLSTGTTCRNACTATTSAGRMNSSNRSALLSTTGSASAHRASIGIRSSAQDTRNVFPGTEWSRKVIYNLLCTTLHLRFGTETCTYLHGMSTARHYDHILRAFIVLTLSCCNFTHSEKNDIDSFISFIQPFISREIV